MAAFAEQLSVPFDIPPAMLAGFKMVEVEIIGTVTELAFGSAFGHNLRFERDYISPFWQGYVGF